MSVSQLAARPQHAVATPQEILARIERLPLSSWQIRTRIIVGTATFFDAFDAFSIASVLPAIRPLWHFGRPEIGLLISAGFFGQLLGALVGGWFAERLGRLPVIAGAMLWFGLFSIACGFAWDYDSLLTLRILQGFGLGAEVPVAATYISELAKAKGRGSFVLLFELVFPVGLLAVSALGTWVVPHLGWQYLFFIGGLPALLVLFVVRTLPESPRWLASRGRTDDAEQAVAFIERKVVAATGKPLPAVASFFETPPVGQARWSELFSQNYLRRTAVVWVCWFATYFANYGLTTWLPSVYNEVFKLPLEQALRYGVVTPAAGLLASFTCAMLIDRVGRRPWFAGAFAWTAVGFITLWLVGPTTPERVLVLSTLSYMGTATLSLSLYLYTAELYPTRMRALGTSTATAWLRFASILGPLVFGNTVAGGSIAFVFLVFGVVALGASIIVAAFGTETKSRVLEEISP